MIVQGLGKILLFEYLPRIQLFSLKELLSEERKMNFILQNCGTDQSETR
jgi:hypothetical protein